MNQNENVYQGLIDAAQSKNYGNLLSHCYRHNFCEINFITKKKWFDKTFIRCVEQMCGKIKNFVSPKKKIRQINYLLISLVKPLLSRNFWEKKVWEKISNISANLRIFVSL